jgi:hypothetical protein
LPYNRAVLILREPLAAMKAEFKRTTSTKKSHTENLNRVNPIGAL